MDPQLFVIEAVLDGLGSVAVVGASASPGRPSHEVASYLIQQNIRVYPVNPRLEKVFALECYPDLASLPERVDVVDVFRRSSQAAEVVDAAIAHGARAVWLQEGVVDEAAADRARRAGLLVVMDRCLLKEHARKQARGAAST